MIEIPNVSLFSLLNNKFKKYYKFKKILFLINLILERFIDFFIIKKLICEEENELDKLKNLK